MAGRAMVTATSSLRPPRAAEPATGPRPVRARRPGWGMRDGQ
jgi:hypothetical protein